MKKKKTLTKAISIILAITTVFSMFAITASAASYSTGRYSVASSSGINVRPSPNSSSRVGAASKDVEFEVTKINGNWGYTSSVKCTNGTKSSGWVCLDYCKKINKTVTTIPSAKYSTGNYMIGSKDGSNVRTGASTNYSKVGSAKYGTIFKVTQIKGNWGYTSSVKCTNGTKSSGWVCLDYCTYKESTTSSTQNNWDKLVGTTVASIKNDSSYTKWYNSTNNVSAMGGYIGECTWYALGRFYEVNGINLKSAPHAKKWLTTYNKNDKVKVLYGANAIVPKSVAVDTAGTYGHVMFIEHVTYSQNGSPEYVYFTECNYDGNSKYNVGKDCILKKLTYKQFISQRGPDGYIVVK